MVNRVQEPMRPGGRRSRLSGMPAPGAPQLALSGLVHRALLSFHERDKQRRRLITMLVLAQGLLFVAAAPAYIGSSPAVPDLILVGVEVLVCVVAWALNQVWLDAAKATYVLVVGGSLAVLCQVFIAALAGDTLRAAHATLLLLTIILEAGLLFAPEVTLIVALGAVGLSGVALVLALALGPAASSRQEYVLLVSFLGLQVVTALIAWLLSGFIYDTAVDAERAKALQFAQVRLDALTTQTAEQHRRLEASVAAMQDTMRRALTGDAGARAAVTSDDLSALSGMLNVVLERLNGFMHADVAHQAPYQAEGEAGQFGVMGRPAEGEVRANALALGQEPDGLAGVAADPVHLVRRLARVREMAGELIGALIHSQDGLTTTAQNAAEALRTVGAAISAADGMVSSAQLSADLALRLRREIGLLVGPRNSDQGDGVHVAEASGTEHTNHSGLLRGLGADLDLGMGTGTELGMGPESAEAMDTPAAMTEDAVEAAALPRESGATIGVPDSEPREAAGAEVAGAEEGGPEGAEQGAAALAAPATSAGVLDGPVAGTSQRARGEAIGPAELRTRLGELSPLLSQLEETLERQEHAASTMTHELGTMNRNARGVDVGVAWAAQALEAIRRNAERLYQTTGNGVQPPRADDSSSVSEISDLPVRAPQPTRPLSEKARLAADDVEGLSGKR